MVGVQLDTTWVSRLWLGRHTECGDLTSLSACERLSASSGTASTHTSRSILECTADSSGGRLVSVALRCIWPQWGRLPNGLPASADITSQQLAGCESSYCRTELTSVFIFMLFFICLTFIHSRDLKYMYYFKSIFVTFTMHAVLIWWMINNKGVTFTSLARSEPLEKQTHIWLVLQAFNAGVGTASSLAVNQGDMARYATKPSAQLWVSLR